MKAESKDNRDRIAKAWQPPKQSQNGSLVDKHIAHAFPPSCCEVQQVRYRSVLPGFAAI